MNEPDHYCVIEKSKHEWVRIYRICVGVRHIGLNAQVRSMLAFAKFESGRFNAHMEANKGNIWAPQDRYFNVYSESSFQMFLDRDEYDKQKAADMGVTECAFPRDFFALIGYDPKRKRYTTPTSATA